MSRKPGGKPVACAPAPLSLALALLLGTITGPPAVGRATASPARSGIGRLPAAEEYSEDRVIGRLGQVSRDQSPIFAQPGQRPLYYMCRKGTYLVLLSQMRRGWYSVLMSDGRIGWISTARVELLDYDIVTRSPAFHGLLGTQEGRRVIATAFRFMGVPYKWGGTSTEGMDCSAFVRAVFALNGKGLPRLAREQARVGTLVPFDQLRAGDRLYFSMKRRYVDHTGIYVGNGYFVHSSSNRHGVAVDSLATPRYARALVCARR